MKLAIKKAGPEYMNKKSNSSISNSKKKMSGQTQSMKRNKNY